MERQIENFVQVIGWGDFVRHSGAVLQRNIERPQRPQQGVADLTREAREQHLQALIGKLRSGATGRVREAIRASAEKILVDEDGSLTLEVKPEGLLGTQTAIADSNHQATGSPHERTIPSGTGRQWKVIGAS